ncbi:hypothetical protein [Pontibacter vulgaris]|uniref:hypothetical protein n=1 Tax=Pontibacter vulgaris TaxID=2905679 RepID=UPI001FA6B3DA|nr:hypothetical protein [Pontibacter vulgaris]
MKKFFIISILSAGMGLGLQQQTAIAADVPLVATSGAVVGTHPTEEKYDKIMTVYANNLKAAFAQKDDAKTIAMINKTTDAFIADMAKLKPELESWVKGMSEQDKEDLKVRSEKKPYIKSMMEIMFDMNIAKRIEANPELQKAMEDSNKRMEALGFEGEGSTEDSGM